VVDREERDFDGYGRVLRKWLRLLHIVLITSYVKDERW
jgi:hypothetical protein